MRAGGRGLQLAFLCRVILSSRWVSFQHSSKVAVGAGLTCLPACLVLCLHLSAVSPGNTPYIGRRRWLASQRQASGALGRWGSLWPLGQGRGGQWPSTCVSGASWPGSSSGRWNFPSGWQLRSTLHGQAGKSLPGLGTDGHCASFLLVRWELAS